MRTRAGSQKGGRHRWKTVPAVDIQGCHRLHHRMLPLFDGHQLDQEWAGVREMVGVGRRQRQAKRRQSKKEAEQKRKRRRWHHRTHHLGQVCEIVYAAGLVREGECRQEPGWRFVGRFVTW